MPVSHPEGASVTPRRRKLPGPQSCRPVPVRAAPDVLVMDQRLNERDPAPSPACSPQGCRRSVSNAGTHPDKAGTASGGDQASVPPGTLLEAREVRKSYGRHEVPARSPRAIRWTRA